jgi:hypothetical protein
VEYPEKFSVEKVKFIHTSLISKAGKKANNSTGLSEEIDR